MDQDRNNEELLSKLESSIDDVVLDLMNLADFDFKNPDEMKEARTFLHTRVKKQVTKLMIRLEKNRINQVDINAEE